MLSSFSCASWPSVCLLWRNVYLDPLPIFGLGCLFFLILSCMSCLYILEINPLSTDSFANIFSHSECCLFILFMVSFAVQKLWSFLRSHLFIFIFITPVGGSKKILLWFTEFSAFVCNNFILFYFILIFWLHCVACGILVPWPGIESVPPAVEAWSPNHWTAREVL